MSLPNWQQIDTVLLDMDGTLLDLHFDNYFESARSRALCHPQGHEPRRRHRRAKQELCQPARHAQLVLHRLLEHAHWPRHHGTEARVSGQNRTAPAHS